MFEVLQKKVYDCQIWSIQREYNYMENLNFWEGDMVEYKCIKSQENMGIL